MKQRLVGTLVLGSLALILIPLLLDGEGIERPPLSANIPPAPVFDTTPLPAPERPDISAAAEFDPTPADTSPVDDISLADAPADTIAASDIAPATDASAEPAGAETTAAIPEPAVESPAVAAATTAEPAAQSIDEPALDAAGLPEAWTVRLGVFGARANADRLVARLVADDYKAYIRPVGVSSGVYVGPVPTQREANAMRQELDGLKEKYQIDNVIVQRFDIAQ